MKQRVKNFKGSEYFPYPLYIKNKLQLNVENDLRIAVAKIYARMGFLCSMHIAHPSH